MMAMNILYVPLSITSSSLLKAHQLREDERMKNEKLGHICT